MNAHVNTNEIESFIGRIQFNDAGLVPAIVQDQQTDEVLMLAWMNQEAVRATIAENRTVYFSRSRNELWRKGETSGHVQQLESIALDCDADTLLVRVNQIGVACHTGSRTCFSDRELRRDAVK